MDKVKIGIPRGIHYYYSGIFWKYFFKKCNIDVIYSSKTTHEILEIGKSLAPDEMCLSMKVYLGHISSLEGKCDYILIPRIDRFDNYNQTCTNFLAIYDLANHYFKTPLLNYNIDNKNHLLDGLIEIGEVLHLSKMKVIEAYEYACLKEREWRKSKNEEQKRILNGKDKKVLIVSHAYNIHDDFIGGSISSMLEQNKIKVVYSDYFLPEETSKMSEKLSKCLYWKYSKESIGAIPLCEKVNGIIFLSTFPCGLDSLVHELMIRKMEKPYLNLVIDDLSSMTGIETRIESFVDLIEQG